MPEFYYAGKEAYRQLEETPQGFAFEFDDESMPVILIKLDAAILTSIIKGCPLELLINNPRLTHKSLSLVIYDNKKYPSWMDGVEIFSKDKVYSEFSPDVINLLGKKEIRLALYNEVLMPIFFTVVPLEFDQSRWEHWITDFYTNPLTLLLPEPSPGLTTQELYRGFPILIANSDHSGEQKLKINFSITEGINANKLSVKGYDFNEYAENGKHGYNQELSIKHILATYFEIGQELFISPLNKDKTEFTDFILLLDDTYILFESKYVLSTKPTKINAALSKAVEQLSRADELIRSETLQLDDAILMDVLKDRKFNLKICLHNDSLYLTTNKCLSIINKFDKMDLPMFMSVSVLNQFLAAFHIKNPEHFHLNLKINLIDRFYDFYTTDEQVIILREFGFGGQANSES